MTSALTEYGKKVLKMAKWITDGTTRVGYICVDGVKKPYIAIEDEKSIVAYGQFRSEQAADEFIERIADFFGVPEFISVAERNDGDSNG